MAYYNGTLSGFLSGAAPTYPNSDNEAAILTPGTYGNATNIPQVVVDAEGHLSSIANVAIAGVPGTISTQEEGVLLSATVNTINFVGAGVTASGAGATTTVTVPAPTITTQEEGVTLSSGVTTLNFVGGGVTASGAGATTTVTIPNTVTLTGDASGISSATTVGAITGVAASWTSSLGVLTQLADGNNNIAVVQGTATGAAAAETVIYTYNINFGISGQRGLYCYVDLLGYDNSADPTYNGSLYAQVVALFRYNDTPLTYDRVQQVQQLLQGDGTLAGCDVNWRTNGTTTITLTVTPASANSMKWVFKPLVMATVP